MLRRAVNLAEETSGAFQTTPDMARGTRPQPFENHDTATRHQTRTGVEQIPYHAVYETAQPYARTEY
jgi:hypothetical protein